MGTFRPVWQPQGPATRCIINGKAMGWLNCTAVGTALAIDRSTLGKKRPVGCSVRRMTKDTIGGLTARQGADVAAMLGVHGDVRVGSNVATPRELGHALRIGRSVGAQGSTAALIRTPYRSTNGPVNHYVHVNEGRGFDGDIPDEVLVYDSAADGRRAGIDQGPTWWEWAVLLDFLEALQPWGEDDPRRLGPGRAYAVLWPDTEPHVLLRFNAKPTTPMPDRTRARAKAGSSVNIHSTPTTDPDTVIGHLPAGELFFAYQRTASGDRYRGSRVWYGDQTGRRWIHAARLTHKGGST